MIYPLFFLVGLLASVVGAISGIGGGILMKPVLELVSDESVQTISFLSGCAVLCMSGVSVLRGLRAGNSHDMSRETPLALGAVAGGLAGKGIFDSVASVAGSGTLGAAQSATLFLMVAALLVYVRFQARIKPRCVKSPLARALLGVALGMMSSFLGIGGGPFNLAVLSFFLAMDAKRAAKCSLYVILFSQAANLIMTLLRGRVPEFSPPLLVYIAAGGVIGGIAGGAVSKRLKNSGVIRVYVGVLAAVLLVTGWNLWGYVWG